VDGKIITKDEAREALGYEPMDAEQEKELKPLMPDFTPNPQNQQRNPQLPNPEPDTEPNLNQRALRAAIEQDLDKWERKALAKGPSAPFESEFIPDDMRADIVATLALAETDEEVRAAFAAPFRFRQASGWHQYP